MDDLEFLDWRYDVGFKWIFGREGREENFLALIKSIADEVQSELIKLKQTDTGLNYLNVERLFQQEDKFKKILYDIFVQLPDNHRVILEMQRKKHQGLGVRVFDYIIQGVKEHQDKNHILIAIMDFDYALWGDKTNNNLVKNLFFIDHAEIITVELSRFNKNLEELESELDYWLYLFKNISQLKEIPDKFIGTPFQKVIEMSRIKALPQQEKADWIRELEEDEVLKDIRKREVDEIVGEVSKISYNEGLEQGRIEGLEERRKLLQKIITQLRAKGISDQEIKSMLDIDSL
jgi:predicted transposase/invertase (TIGR01784 family)